MLHRYRTLILFTILSLLPWWASSQGQDYGHVDSINWKGVQNMTPGNGLSYRILHFEGAVNADQWGLLPVYHYRSRIAGNYLVEDAEVVPVTTSEFDPGVPGDIFIEDLGLIRENFQIRSWVSVSRGENYLNVEILPLSKSPGGGIIMLEKFSFSVRLIETDPRSLSAPLSYSEHSVLSSGKWFKVAVRESGMHMISYNDLNSMGMDVGNIDPRNLRIYGNGNGMLPEPNSIERPDDLLQNAIMVLGEEDGSFDPDDAIIFYGYGPDKWSYSYFYELFDHENNLYTDRIYYFITADLGPGLRVAEKETISGMPSDTIYHCDVFAAHEKDDINLIKSGKEWYGEVFSTQLSYEFEFDFPDLDLSYPLFLKSNFAARSTETSNFRIYAENELIAEEEMANVYINSPVFARSKSTNSLEFTADDNTISVRIEYDRPNNTAVGWLNYIQLNGTGRMNFLGGQKKFTYSPFSGTSDTLLYRVTAEADPLMIWDITEPSNIDLLDYESWEDGFSFVSVSDTRRDFVVFDNSAFYSVEFVEEVENQDLHGLGPYEMVIVSHPLFLKEAERLAEHHRNHSDLSVFVTTPGKIYNEFSSGSPDPTAIRDFMKMLYFKAEESERPRYLLLFGDGSYDYKDRIENNHNLIPTFQSRESLKLPTSFVTDDYFGCFDLGEGSNGSGDLDIGIGRFPVVDEEQAKIAVDKTIYYATGSENVMGGWRNRISFIADDEDGNIHLQQAEGLCNIVDTSDAVYNIQKIYFDAYPQVKTTAGDRFPGVASAIDRTVDEGVLIMNYTGHGGELGLGHERVLDIAAINSWTNIDKLPVFVTATCEFSRFDDPGLTSAGELVFLNSRGGGIALYTTTRLAYSQSNYGLNKKFYEHAFDYDETREEYARLGDLIRKAKTPSNSNIKNFVLLGDPALMMAYPEKNVITTEVINDLTGQDTDTLKSLSEITVLGQIVDRHGEVVSDMNGFVYPVIYDKPVQYQTLVNDPSSKLTEFELMDRVIFSGKATVSQGNFQFSFVVPKDISYNIDKGKISYFAYDTVNYRNFHGYEMIRIGGVDPNASVDGQGPEISLFLNHTGFKSGDVTTRNPVLLADLFDVSGINTVGNGIGHDITAVLNNDHQNPVVLNPYYSSDLDTYQSGSIIYPLGNLPDGHHTLTLKAWDVHNNSSERTIEFIIDGESPISLTEVLNYPNPFRDLTKFEFRHNKPGEDLDILVNIYDMTGRLVRSLEHRFNTEFLISEPLMWDGRSEDGSLLPSGIYIYNIMVENDGLSPALRTNKLMIIR